MAPAESMESAYHRAYHSFCVNAVHSHIVFRVKGQQDLNAGGHENCTTAAIKTARWRPRNLHA